MKPLPVHFSGPYEPRAFMVRAGTKGQYVDLRLREGFSLFIHNGAEAEALVIGALQALDLFQHDPGGACPEAELLAALREGDQT